MPRTVVDLRGPILILTHLPLDARQISKRLAAAGFECVECASFADAAARLTDAAMLLTTEEALGTRDTELTAAIKSQPSWSAIPILIFYARTSASNAIQRKAAHPLQQFADLSFLERPVTVLTLLSAVRAAIRDRRRQLHVKHLLNLVQVARDQAEHARVVADQANLSKSQFLANMSHEIRTPLGAIMGFLDLLKSPQNSVADNENYISVIDRNSIQLLRLIDDILDLSKVEAGKLTIEAIDFSLGDVIADCAALMGFKARDKGIFFTLSLSTPLPSRGRSDPVRLRQILNNIVGNAIKFTDTGKVELILGYVDGHLVITVKDTGRGISDDQRERLFQPFSQADNSTTRRFGGTGLGLVLTRYLTEAMGGSFTLMESEFGHGSTFEAKVALEVEPGVPRIDLNHLSSVSLPRRTEDREALRGLRVLMVEDSLDNQALFSIFLSQSGATVEIASDGAEGVERALSRRYDVILMDVQMPILDGHQATRQLRLAGCAVPIIALTAHAMKDEEVRALESGFSGFLTKPVKKDILIATISKYGRGHLFP